MQDWLLVTQCLRPIADMKFIRKKTDGWRNRVGIITIYSEYRIIDFLFENIHIRRMNSKEKQSRVKWYYIRFRDISDVMGIYLFLFNFHVIQPLMNRIHQWINTKRKCFATHTIYNMRHCCTNKNVYVKVGSFLHSYEYMDIILWW